GCDSLAIAERRGRLSPAEHHPKRLGILFPARERVSYRHVSRPFEPNPVTVVVEVESPEALLRSALIPLGTGEEIGILLQDPRHREDAPGLYVDGELTGLVVAMVGIERPCQHAVSCAVPHRA